mmetsp:Transcript_28339/g.47625  ORF Transcript_28339/g.47625 Transcript_28339/m.47625 type:complete len:171 (-) Transcript_28339:966-1478(-)
MSSEPLLNALMSIVLENAGAERGLLILAGGDWRSSNEVHREFFVRVKGYVSPLDDSASLVEEGRNVSDKSSSDSTSDMPRHPMLVKVDVSTMSLESPEVLNEVPRTIIRFVIQTKRMVLLDSASETGAFTSDPYIQQRKVGSVVCVPVVHHNILLGTLYLVRCELPQAQS